MEEADVYAIMSDTIWTILMGAGPILALALLVGLGIAIFQALTQVQEMTLTFVPKIVAIFVGLVLALPFIYATLSHLSDTVFDLIMNGPA
ncbi:flagellar biosynthetic protein FliQ [Thioclava sediminum]|uniref:Flagellar biosynthetic protein FliQ n=2 Tax=Thioclava TaxID=285107 RepID=A0ABX6YQK7_9RHOB|nr:MULTISPECIES: flagellar biosynthesis protein FliQ [Thioclava]OOY22194.1 flagellar biosynthetic protein FliQ [Thioclava sp. DLFJ5-1]OOY26035.1 flagellar biosynthetic protein FliQ [Thioclava sediminum]PFG61906.1 flagellar biosynthetic protein FliQ [Thioclava sp. ES.031]QPZ89837.1 flagellar biosynthesis protein FliQ [Thioclava electrotropha]